MPTPTERLAMTALATGIVATGLAWLSAAAFPVGALAVLLGAVAYLRGELAGAARVGQSWAVLGMLGGTAPFAFAALLMVAAGFGGPPYHLPPLLP